MPDVTYLIGDDVLAEAYGTTTDYLLYDGHGSVRQHANDAGTVAAYQHPYDPGTGTVTANYNSFDYDGYGVALTPLPSDNNRCYYTGEQWDSSAQMYYLRARYYDPSNGRFNQMDDFPGNNEDPQSLHKYLYCHANPVNGVDPSGMFVSIAALPGTIGLSTHLTAIMAAVVLTAAVKALDMLGDAIRMRGLLLHVRDKTLVRLANSCNNGAQVAGTFGKMYFQPFNSINPFDFQGLANIAVHNIGVYGLIRTGLWDSRTMLGIQAFISNCPNATMAISSDPSLGKPSRKADLIVSAAKNSWYAPYFNGGIAVEYEANTWSPVRFFMKHVVTLPGERVDKGKYVVIPLP